METMKNIHWMKKRFYNQKKFVSLQIDKEVLF